MNNRYTLKLLQERIGYTFKDETLLKRAVTHSSFVNEQKINKHGDYERLEFLGDAVLELVSSEFLYKEHSKVPEGELSKMRASMVCEPSLAFCARDLELGKFILLGKGEENTGGRERDSIISDVMEAVTGAIYLDGGFEPAKEFINKFILSDLENKRLFYDSKSNLQEIVQSKMKTNLCYKLLSESGPEHDKEFVVEVFIADKSMGKGKGRTKKAAEQQAAYQALLALRDKGYVSKKY
jgi:ribonuclease-3